MRPITRDKVVDLSENEYKVDVSYKTTAPSVFTDIVAGNILKLKNNEMKVALSLLAKLGIKFYDNITSRDMFYSKIRKPILDKYGKEKDEYKQTLELMKITKAQRTKLNTEANKKVRQANKTRKTYYSEDIINVIQETKDSSDWATEAISLMLASGCRPIELLDKNTFKVDRKQKDWVIVGNIAKKRQGKQDTTTSRPVIGYTAQGFVKAVADFRESISDRELYIDKGANKGQLKKANVSLISRRLKKYFPDEITPKTLRKLYGNLSHLLYGGTSNLNIWLGDVLGHDEKDKNTSFSYSTLRVVLGNKDKNSDNANMGNPELEVKTEILNKKSEMLKTQLEKMNERLDNFGTKIDECDKPCKPNKRNLTTEKKEQIVKDTIERMVKDGMKISQERVICESGISWRITRGVVSEWKAKKNKK